MKAFLCLLNANLERKWHTELANNQVVAVAAPLWPSFPAPSKAQVHSQTISSLLKEIQPKFLICNILERSKWVFRLLNHPPGLMILTLFAFKGGKLESMNVIW